MQYLHAVDRVTSTFVAWTITSPGLCLEYCFSALQDLSNSLWALARLDVTPTHSWMGMFSAQAHSIAHTFKPQEVANTVWAFARLGVRPGEPLLDRLFEGTDHRWVAQGPELW